MGEFNYRNTIPNVWNDYLSGIISAIFVIVTLMEKRFPKKALSVLIIVNRFI
jgi:hypothetical protein